MPMWASVKSHTRRMAGSLRRRISSIFALAPQYRILPPRLQVRWYGQHLRYLIAPSARHVRPSLFPQLPATHGAGEPVHDDGDRDTVSATPHIRLAQTQIASCAAATRLLDRSTARDPQQFDPRSLVWRLNHDPAWP
jgi:hypothetical protein